MEKSLRDSHLFQNIADGVLLRQSPTHDCEHVSHLRTDRWPANRSDAIVEPEPGSPHVEEGEVVAGRDVKVVVLRVDLELGRPVREKGSGRKNFSAFLKHGFPKLSKGP